MKLRFGHQTEKKMQEQKVLIKVSKWLQGSSCAPGIRLCVFSPLINLVTEGEGSHTKQAVLMHCEVSLIQVFLLA